MTNTERDQLAALIAREGADFHADEDADTTYLNAADLILAKGWRKTPALAVDDATVEKLREIADFAGNKGTLMFDPHGAEVARPLWQISSDIRSALAALAGEDR